MLLAFHAFVRHILTWNPAPELTNGNRSAESLHTPALCRHRMQPRGPTRSDM